MCVRDIILFSGGIPTLWLFTNKAGEIARKKRISWDQINKRFVKLALRSKSNADKLVCVARNALGDSHPIALNEFLSLSEDAATVDAIQSFVRGRNGGSGLFYNEYRIVDDKSKSVSVTFRVADRGEHIRSQATSINATIESLALKVVRFIESNQRVKILQLNSEWIFDENDNPWLVWISTVTTVSGHGAQDLSLAGLRSSSRGRLSKSAGFPQISSSGDNPRASTAQSRSRSRSRSPIESRRILSASSKEFVPSMGYQLGYASDKVEGAKVAESALRRSSAGFRFENNDGTKTMQRDPFPSPFQCSGDFCSFNVQDPKNLTDERTPSALDIARRLLTENEWNDLMNRVDAKTFSLPLEDFSDTKAEHYLSFKSIALSRKERRTIAGLKGVEASPISTIVTTPHFASAKQKGAALKADNTYGSSFANYYRQVRVCDKCFMVYSTLDKARNLVQSKPRSSSSSEKKPAARVLKGRKKVNHEIAEEKRVKRSFKARKKNGDVSRQESRRMFSQPGMQSFEDLDGYLRGKKAAAAESAESKENSASERQITLQESGAKTPSVEFRESKASAARGTYRGKVLIVEADDEVREGVQSSLSQQGYACTVARNGTRAVQLTFRTKFDLLLTARELPTLSGIEVTKMIRQRESEQSASDADRLPIVVLTGAASQEDLTLYLEVGMDGFVSKPIDETHLRNTVAAAIPFHRPPKSSRGGSGSRSASQHHVGSSPHPLRGTTTSVVGGTVNGGQRTASPHLTLPIPATSQATPSVFQLDADTAITYIVLGEKRKDSCMFNFVVVNDFFDTFETMQIFFTPIVSKYPGVQVLLFNLPGQAFTEWRKDAVLNNAYYASCLNSLLRHVDYVGTGQFHNSGPYASPFILMGNGNGANVALYHALKYTNRNMRSVLSFNGFANLDPHLAAVLHDCLNVFSCSPPTRPDLPVYFFTRYVFSASYLSRVSAPLAINLYTAVHNPISLEGRMQICKGALAHSDLREMLKSATFPILLVQSSQGGLVKPLHVKPFINILGGEVPTIKRCLKERKRPCVVWMRSGHEMFQEVRRPVLNLLEQLATGYHEKHDTAFVAHPSIKEYGNAEDAPSMQRTRKPSEAAAHSPENFEDRFIDNVLETLREVRVVDKVQENPFAVQAPMPTPALAPLMTPPENYYAEETVQITDTEQWHQYERTMVRNARATGEHHRNEASQKREKILKARADARKGISFHHLSLAQDSAMTLDPFDPSFERRDNIVYKTKTGSKLYPTGVPEVKEYMQWRVARNKKRLAKLEEACSCMQRAWRAYLARTLVQRMREEKAALLLQTNWRGRVGRERLKMKKREDWACKLVQRNWRGRAGREIFRKKRLANNAAKYLQRIYRGRLGKHRVQAMRKIRNEAARLVQTTYRAHKARGVTWRRRMERNAAIDIQRCFRGYLGKRRATHEREKYLFSKAQSQGIDFGRQMLLEHKLHGTRLQSAVTLLTREKVACEENVESLLAEIAEFDEGVRNLEREMHDLSKVESEAKGVLDEEARVELREQKMRLDREFAVMLEKIADRKERLKMLEIKLQTIDRTRQAKEEELRDLERKLVVLLEEQQKELHQIKQRQEKKGEYLLKDASASIESIDGSPVSSGGGPGGGGRGTGPSIQQQQQANALMESTESLMKFGFMSMSLTYFSSLNMVRAMRRVGALNTIMNGEGGRALMNGPGGVQAAARGKFVPKLEDGKMPGQEKTEVSSWTVPDVGDWLESLSLGQYQDCFADAAIDGSFLYDLNDEDLRNTLGIEHNLHRKKILISIRRMRASEAGGTMASVSQMQSSAGPMPSLSSSPAIPLDGGVSMMSSSITDSGALEDVSRPAMPNLRYDELVSWVRHGKSGKLAEAFQKMPDRVFDKHDLEAQYVDGFGTQYIDVVRKSFFHFNKTDDHGNTLLTIAAQNGQMKCAQLLVSKGAYPDHQNNQGQTPLHYAMTYSFFDLGAWLADGDSGAGADDTISNIYGLSAYDGLSPDE